MSSIFHLNDAAEFSYTVNLTRSRLEQRRKTSKVLAVFADLLAESLDNFNLAASTVFVGSFTEQPDMLSQWRAYCGDRGGFSIGLSSRTLLTLGTAQEFRLVRCIYSRKLQERIVDELLDAAYSQFLGENDKSFAPVRAGLFCYLNLIHFAPLFKHPSFREEREWRLVSTDMLRRRYRPKFRAGRSMVVPYVEFKLGGGRSSLPISRVFMGPTPNVAASIFSVSQLLYFRGLSACKIEVSSVPYRNW
jgi:hypothetical protein